MSGGTVRMDSTRRTFLAGAACVAAVAAMPALPALVAQAAKAAPVTLLGPSVDGVFLVTGDIIMLHGTPNGDGVYCVCNVRAGVVDVEPVYD